MTAQQMIQKAQQLEDSADLLNNSLLAWSMTEQAMRDEAQTLRAKAAVEGNHWDWAEVA